MSVLAAMRITSPLPQRHLTETSGVGGRIKARPEDFLVDEIPLYQARGEGEHVHLGIQKSGVAHGELMSCLRRHFGVRDVDIGYAGMKDKVGITRQTVSIHLPGKAMPDLNIDHARIRVLWAARHGNKIRLGHLAGNRFSIRIRDVDPMRAPTAQRTLRALERHGVPNYFDAQRFGYRHNNHRVGAALLGENWSELVHELLGTSGRFPEYQRDRRLAFEQGRLREAAMQWTTADRAERIVAERLAMGKSPREAVLAVREPALSFWASALQSAIFNRVLDSRLDDRALDRLADGDLAWKHDSRAVFAVSSGDVGDQGLRDRLDSLEVSPSGPLWGRGMMQSSGPTALIEREALEAGGLTIEQLTANRLTPQGARRPLRVPIQHAGLESGIDEHGSYIRVAFDLSRGSYATIVLREIMKSEDAMTDDSGT